MYSFVPQKLSIVLEGGKVPAGLGGRAAPTSESSVGVPFCQLTAPISRLAPSLVDSPPLSPPYVPVCFSQAGMPYMELMHSNRILIQVYEKNQFKSESVRGDGELAVCNSELTGRHGGGGWA